MEEFEQKEEFSQIDNLNVEFKPTIKPIKPKKETFKTDSWVFHFLCIFGVIFASLFFLLQIYLTPIKVVGQSMLPTINASTTSDLDTTHCDIVYFKEKETYTYGDIVIISNEDNKYNFQTTTPPEKIIKRVIACPGDKITFQLTSIEGHKYYYETSVTDKNGNKVELNEDSYIYEKMYFDDTRSYSGFYINIYPNILNNHLGLNNRNSTITVSNNCYFVMGDNRNNSGDSRLVGEISQEDILGNVRLQVKYNESIWVALFEKLKSYLSTTYIFLKENL